MARIDIKTTETGDLFINNGDFATFESDDTHKQDIIQTNRGEWKEFPLCGVGIQNYLNAESPEQELEKIISIQFEADRIKAKIQVLFDENGMLQIGC